jgi:GNAT superfamily N-acetyltransferase
MISTRAVSDTRKVGLGPNGRTSAHTRQAAASAETSARESRSSVIPFQIVPEWPKTDTTMNPPVPEITFGYRPGIIGRVTEMHATFYARHAGFGRVFESQVAGGLAEFVARPDNPGNGLWAAVTGECIVGAIVIDGQDLGPGIAHLRWFIVDDGIRGGGIGRQLIAAAVAFCDRRAFIETHLWTFQGLDAARKLYETNGFKLAEERPGDQWGTTVLEQRFVRPGQT